MFFYFRSEHNLNQVSIPHATYHHFLGNGLSDSNLDRILFSSSLKHLDVLVTIHCKLEDPLIDSHHDLIVSKWELPTVTPEPSSSVNLVAPKVENPRVKILWNDTGIEKYQHLVAPHLLRLQDLWLDSSSKTSVSLLIESTNNVLLKCASLSTQFVRLSNSKRTASSKDPIHIRMSKNRLLKMN